MYQNEALVILHALKIETLSLAWLEYLTEEQIESIVKRCRKLKALDLRGTVIH